MRGVHLLVAGALFLALFAFRAHSPYGRASTTVEFPGQQLTAAKVAELEGQIRLPLGAGRLSQYERYYDLEMVNDQPVVTGRFLVRGDGAPGAVHIEPKSDWADRAGGNCDVVHLVWIANASPTLFCNHRRLFRKPDSTGFRG